jgi:hypothetical protein
MEACFSEKSVDFQLITRRHVPEGREPFIATAVKNLKSYDCVYSGLVMASMK